MIEKMARVQFIGLRSELPETIELLQELGVVQLENFAQQSELGLTPYVLSKEDEQQKEIFELALVNADGLLERFQSLNRKRETLAPAQEFPTTKDAVSRLNEIMREEEKLVKESSRNCEELTLLSRYREIVKAISTQLPAQITDASKKVFTGLVRTNEKVDLLSLDSILKELPDPDQIRLVHLHINPDGLQVISVIYPPELQVEVDALLKRSDLFELSLPDKFSSRQPDEALQGITEEVIACKRALAEYDKQMKELAGRWTLSLKVIRSILINKIEVINALKLAGMTEETFNLIGWCIQANTAGLEKTIRKRFDGLVSLLSVEIPPGQKDRIPVAINNPAFLQPYKEIVDVRSIPSYNDIDPTGLVALFLPLFFGYMVGDIGYGILIFIFSKFLKRVKIPGLIGSLIKTFQMGALWSIVFGFLFGEFFGSLGLRMGLQPILFNRGDPAKTTLLMGIAIGVGIFQVIVGLIIGVWNGFSHHEYKRVVENLGTFLALMGILFLAGGISGILLHVFSVVGVVLLALGLTGTASTMGLKGIFLAPIEFVGVLGSILSYLRLAALGLASVFLAEVANDLAGRLGSVVVGVMVAVIIHSINLVMGMFSPTIQSMRLQFVEFFSRFFIGGGRQFNPFKMHELNE